MRLWELNWVNYLQKTRARVRNMLNISSHELIIWRRSGDCVIIFTRLLGSPIDSRSFSLDLILLFSKTLKSHSFLFAPVSPFTFNEQMITFTYFLWFGWNPLFFLHQPISMQNKHLKCHSDEMQNLNTTAANILVWHFHSN